MAKHRDFGDIIAAEFKKGNKKGAPVILNITNAGGNKRRVKIVQAGPDSFSGYIGNMTSPEFSTILTVFNPDQIVSYERVQ